MIGNILLASFMLVNPTADLAFDYSASAKTHAHEMKLSPSERDRIWREIHFAIKKMGVCMRKAEQEAKQIKDIDTRDATVGAIEGAITGLSGRSPYTVVIGGCLGALSRIAGNAYTHFHNSRNYVREAETYGRIADELQERLWRD